MSDSHTLGEDKNTRAPCVPPVWGAWECCRCHPFSHSRARTNPQGSDKPSAALTPGSSSSAAQECQRSGATCRGDQVAFVSLSRQRVAINLGSTKAKSTARVITQVVLTGQDLVSSASGGVAQPFWAPPARCAQLLMPLLGVPRARVTAEFPVLASLPCSQGKEGGLKAEIWLHAPSLLQGHF